MEVSGCVRSVRWAAGGSQGLHRRGHALEAAVRAGDVGHPQQSVPARCPLYAGEEQRRSECDQRAAAARPLPLAPVAGGARVRSIGR